MEIQFRPYSMVAQLSTTDSSSIILRDTAGTALKCNFISVEASGEAGDAFYRASIESANQTTTLSDYSPVSSATTGHGTVSGVVGGYATVNKGVVELLLADNDRTSVLNLELSENNICNFYITYGQVQAGNIMRDNQRPVGS